MSEKDNRAPSPLPHVMGSEPQCEHRQICPDIASGVPCRGPCDLRQHYSQTIIDQMGQNEIPVLMHTAPPTEQMVVPDGWAVVPVKPTMDMVKNAAGDHEGENWLPHSLWASMLSAAPPPPVQMVGGDTTFVLTDEDHIVLSETSPNAVNSAGWRHDQIDWKFVKALCQAFSTRVGEGSYDQFMDPVQQRWLTAMKAALIDATAEVNPIPPSQAGKVAE